MSRREASTPCPRCGATRLVLVRCESGPHYGKRLCGECRRFRGWAPWPMTPEKAGASELHFGRFQGWRLDALAATADGRGYLLWLGDQPWLKGRLRSAVWV